MKRKGSNNFLLYLIGFVAAVILVICLIVAAMSNDNFTDEVVSLQLNGSETMYLYVGETFKDPGFVAEGSVTGDISKYVKVDGEVNTAYVGVYEVSYTLNYNGALLNKNRKVKVESKPVASNGIQSNINSEEEIQSGKNDVSKSDKTDKVKITLKGYSHIYLLKGVTYSDEGAVAFTNDNEDISSQIVKKGSVDINAPGAYEITYTITDSTGNSASVTRIIDVLNMSVSSTVSTNQNTNKSVVLKISVTADKFNHIILPDGVKVTTQIYEYIISDNGKYSFKVYNEYGLYTVYTYTINNIDKIAPSGSCSGYTTGKKSYINIKANDNVGVSKYIINNKGYTSNSIILDEVISNPVITIYDTVGNSKSISCSLENRYTFVTSDPGITYSYEYVNDGTTMPYSLHTPSSALQNESTPLLVWLHGSGELGTSEAQFRGAGLTGVINGWDLDGFNAYVICPHLTGKYYGNWTYDSTLEQLNTLLDKIIKEKNIDTDKIMLSGHSFGGRGAISVAYYSQNRYSSLAVMSGYYTGVDMSKITIPTVGYVGTPAAGEDSASYSFMVGSFKKQFGEKNTFVRNVSHGALPRTAFMEDANNDNKSDLMEWMLSQ